MHVSTTKRRRPSHDRTVTKVATAVTAGAAAVTGAGPGSDSSSDREETAGVTGDGDSHAGVQ